MLSYSVTQMMDESDRRGRLDDIEAFIRTGFGGNVTETARGRSHNQGAQMTVAARR